MSLSTDEAEAIRQSSLDFFLSVPQLKKYLGL